MSIASLHLKQFKRFTDLRLAEIPAETKLVLLIGANGCGKSCVFDALHLLPNRIRRSNFGLESRYHQKSKLDDPEIELILHGDKHFSRKGGNLMRGNSAALGLFGRSANRIPAQIARSADSEKLLRTDGDSPRWFIAEDRRIFADIMEFTGRIDHALRAPTFEGKAADTLAIFKEHIDPFNASLRRIFGDDPAKVIQMKNYDNSDHSKPVQLNFAKGVSEVPFDLLSHGEKQIVVLLLGFLMRNQHYANSIFYIDEMDLHLNTALQKTVLAEIVEHWIPDGSQLWTASHALGFIEYANEAPRAVILDFDHLDFDQPQTITPKPKDHLDLFEIAVPRESLGKLFAGRKLVVCEGKDHPLYNAALDDASALFVPGGNADQVFKIIAADSSLWGLRDRDFLLAGEIEIIKKQYPHYRILPCYSIENLLYHPENIASLDKPGFDPETWKRIILETKPPAHQLEVKHARGRISELRSIQSLQQARAVESNPDEIYTAYQSPDFEMAYTVIPMKRLPLTHLAPFNLAPSELAQAPWFKARIREIIS